MDHPDFSFPVSAPIAARNDSRIWTCLLTGAHRVVPVGNFRIEAPDS
jgi:hypothetical protein